MNVISKCYQELFGQHGPSLFDLPSVSEAPGMVMQTLQQCHASVIRPVPEGVGKVRVRGKKACLVPGGTIKWVAATCSEQYSGANVLYEPPDSGLPAGLLASPALVQVIRGTVYVQVINIGTKGVILYPRTGLGQLSSVALASLPKGVSEVQSMSASSSSPSVVVEHIKELDFSPLTESEQVLMRTLLLKYHAVFSVHDGDLGCTNQITHDIPLLDSVPVKQRYRRIPPSDYKAVKTHIHQFLQAQVIRESNSPYASPIVLVWKKEGSLRMCVDYRQLNSKTRKDAFPLPHIEKSLDALSGARWFSTMDLASGYNQVVVNENDRAKTAFCAPLKVV